ncbi:MULTISPECIES: hypothetical protein [unclassified Bradyrhizobium]|uniref:hypothetical protein n=1 Tax=unclassified Bradyrhizobium TaxID=2631580 RepID=UPI0028EA56C0|nr:MULTISPECIES: hypothetical protein [unclassified Bradyrhizobium]
MMQLIAPTPMKALRQPRKASLSSDCLTCGAAAITTISSIDQMSCMTADQKHKLAANKAKYTDSCGERPTMLTLA